MQTKKLFQEILTQCNIELENLEAKDVAKIMLLTSNLLYILDPNKAIDYKIALIQEYLEGMQNISPDPSKDLLTYIATIQNKDEKELLVIDFTTLIFELADIIQLTPMHTPFWLQKNSSMQSIKEMEAILLFLNRKQQQKIFSYDESLMQDKKWQILKNSLPN